jgi:hypothetical protein
MRFAMNAYVKKFVLSIGLAGLFLGAITVPATAQVGVNIRIGPQPPPRREYMGHPPRPGCFFRHGHYAARGHRWVWIPGRWICR